VGGRRGEREVGGARCVLSSTMAGGVLLLPQLERESAGLGAAAAPTCS
jgi:hypothetical protein